jgi:hypothetical protein
MEPTSANPQPAPLTSNRDENIAADFRKGLTDDIKSYIDIQTRLSNIDIQTRLHKVETYWKIAGVVAAIFGFSGAWGLTAFQSGKAELDKLKVSVAEQQKNIEIIKNALKEADKILEQIDKKKAKFFLKSVIDYNHRSNRFVMKQRTARLSTKNLGLTPSPL